MQSPGRRYDTMPSKNRLSASAHCGLGLRYTVLDSEPLNSGPMGHLAVLMHRQHCAASQQRRYASMRTSGSAGAQSRGAHQIRQAAPLGAVFGLQPHTLVSAPFSSSSRTISSSPVAAAQCSTVPPNSTSRAATSDAASAVCAQQRTLLPPARNLKIPRFTVL